MNEISTNIQDDEAAAEYASLCFSKSSFDLLINFAARLIKKKDACTMVSIAYPPPKFDHPYKGPVIERHISMEQIDRICSPFGHGDGLTLYGCAYHLAKSCYIIFPKDMSAQLQKQIYAHERGHCNGWQHD